jgi:hydrogenase maturation protease
MGNQGRVVVIGVGSEFRRDDGAGPDVITRLRGQVPAEVELQVSDGDPARILEAWQGATLAVVVDTVLAEPAQPGRLHRLILDRGQPVPDSAVSSHGLGLTEAIGLGQVLGQMPERLIVHAVEAGNVSLGTGLSQAVAAAIPALVAAVLRELG